MKEIRNKIIALSGEPVAGKGTTTKAILEELKGSGYGEDNIHIITTGNEFRRYFNTALDFLKSLEERNKKEYTRLAKTPEMKDIFGNKEFREAFEKSVIMILVNNIDISSLTINEMNNLKELQDIRKTIDSIIDTRMANIGKEINSEEKPNEIWLVDSRLAFHNIPEAFSVRLTTNSDVAAKRLIGDKTRGSEDNSYNSLEEAKKEREARRIGERNRYIERYGIDLENPDNYDLIIDTSYADPADTASTILKCMEHKLEKKPFTKNWISPKLLLPLQNEREMLSKASMTFEEMYESIERNGFLPDEPIEIVEVDGYKGIIEGHHRNFAAAELGKTLVPYKVIGKDEDKLKYGGGTPTERFKTLTSNILYGHEEFIEIGEKKKNGVNSRFSYDDVYPGIYQKIKKLEQEKDER